MDDGWIDGWVDECMDDGWLDGWMGEWIYDGWMDRWMDEWMDGWMKSPSHFKAAVANDPHPHVASLRSLYLRHVEFRV